MFNIEQLKFFSLFFVTITNVLMYHWSISWIHFSVLFQCRPCFPGALLHSVSEHFCHSAGWGAGSQVGATSRYNLSLVLCPILGEILSLIPSFATDILGSLGQKPVTSWKPQRGNNTKAAEGKKGVYVKLPKTRGVIAGTLAKQKL